MFPLLLEHITMSSPSKEMSAYITLFCQIVFQANPYIYTYTYMYIYIYTYIYVYIYIYIYVYIYIYISEWTQHDIIHLKTIHIHVWNIWYIVIYIIRIHNIYIYIYITNENWIFNTPIYGIFFGEKKSTSGRGTMHAADHFPCAIEARQSFTVPEHLTRSPTSLVNTMGW